MRGFWINNKVSKFLNLILLKDYDTFFNTAISSWPDDLDLSVQILFTQNTFIDSYIHIHTFLHKLSQAPRTQRYYKSHISFWHMTHGNAKMK